MSFRDRLNYLLHGPGLSGPPVSSALHEAEDAGFAISGRQVSIEGTGVSVSADSLGIDISALAKAHDHVTPEGGLATAAAAVDIPSVSLLYGAPDLPHQAIKDRTLQNWTLPQPQAGVTPILEFVNDRVQRSRLSLAYYLTDGVVGPAVDILAEFPLNRGFEVQAIYDSEEFPVWFDPDWLDPDSLVDAFGNSRIGNAVSEWITAQCEDLSEQLNLTYHMVDLQKEAYIHGDAFVYRVDSIQNTKYDKDQSRIYPENTIADLQSLNPSAVWLKKDVVGLIEFAQVVGGPGTQRTDLELDRLVHLKHKGSAYSTYGFPVTQRAFRDLELKDAYLSAGTAWGQRYALPVKMLKYGVLVRAGQNSGPVATERMRRDAERAVEEYDPTTGQTIVAPFHWDYSFIGAEGATAMVISNEVMEANRRIMGAIGIPSAFLYGDWTNYATARIQYSGLMHRLKTSQTSLARLLEMKVFNWFCRIRGYVDNNGNPIKVIVRWKRAHLEDDSSYMQFVAELAAIPGILSPETVRESVGFDDNIEEQRFAKQRDRDLRIQKQQQEAYGLPLTAPGQPAAPADPSAEDDENDVEDEPDNSNHSEDAPAGDGETKKTKATLTANLEQSRMKLATDAQTVYDLLGPTGQGSGESVQRACLLRLKQDLAVREACVRRLADLGVVAWR